jgi:serine/threonine-protein kinase HipA
LTRRDLLEYFALERLEINERMLAGILERFRAAVPVWNDLLERSFLSPAMKSAYAALLSERRGRLGL